MVHRVYDIASYVIISPYSDLIVLVSEVIDFLLLFFCSDTSNT